MKYDRPVWQLMHACADEMPDVFRYDDVRTWFARNFPEVGDATLRAHVVGLTEGGTKHSQFRRRSPIFRRVARGEYAPIPLAERGELPEDDDDQSGPPLVRFQPVDSTRDVESPPTSEPLAADPVPPETAPSPHAHPGRIGGERVEPMAPPRTAEDFWPYPARSAPTSDDASPDDSGGEQAGRSFTKRPPRWRSASTEQREPEGNQDVSPPEEPEIDLDRQEFDRAERDRLAFEAGEREAAARDEREREELEREERQLRRTLHPLWDDPPLREAEERDRASSDDDHSAHPASPGGIVIVRAPQRPDEPSAAAEARNDDTAAPTGDLDLGEAEAVDAIVLGSLGHLDDRLGVPAPARDAFRDLEFRRARRAAELSGARWFVLSADHGLLEPTDWMSPEDTFDATTQPRHRAAWAAWVVARLEALVGTLDDLVVQVEAPDEMGLPVISALLDAGAAATTGPVHALAPPLPTAADTAVDEDRPATEPAASSPDLRFAAAPSVAAHLAEAQHAVGASEAAMLVDGPGIYAWSVDHDGARVLNRALMLPVRAGVIFVGQVGAGRGGSSLSDHLVRVQLQGRARSSTFRSTLATTLAVPLALRTMDDPDLQQWMLKHLTVAVWPTHDVDELRELTRSVIGVLRPPLNLDHVGAQEYRRRLAELGARRG